MTAWSTKPLAAKTLIYTSSDTIEHVSSGDAGGDFALDNIIEPNQGPNLQLRGRTNAAATGDGFLITLATETEASCVGIVGIDSNPLPAAATVQVLGKNAAAATTFDTGTNELIRPSSIYTADANAIIVDDPVSPAWIPGYDTLATPAPPGTPAVDTWLCKTLEFTFQTAGTDYVEAAYVALGIDARSLEDDITETMMTIEPVALFQGGGTRWVVSWPFMALADARYLRDLWQWSAYGTWPVFFFPAAGQKSSTGTLTDDTHGPEHRGGLVRLLGVKWTSSKIVGTSKAVGVELRFETWQQTPVGGM